MVDCRRSAEILHHSETFVPFDALTHEGGANCLGGGLDWVV